MPLVIATTNPGKLREIRPLLDGLTDSLLSLSAFAPIPEPAETGRTFAENARLKAIYYSNAIGLPCVADDSGLEIAALDSAPGVHSARWYGDDYAVKFRKIFELLRARGVSGSPARFVCAVALADRGHVLTETEGVVEGQISQQPRGTNGFGYDPIFFYPPFDLTLGEIDLDRKASVSHRGHAFSALRARLLADPKLLRNQ